MFNENLFLIILGLVWIIGAIIQDFRKREVANWWNFSLIAVALAYRAFLSVFYADYRYFAFGLFGFAVFFALANLFYYGRVFAGGDAKLLMGLGAILPFASSIYSNLFIFGYFIFLFLFCGGIYGLFYSFALVGKNYNVFKKEFSRQFDKNKKLFDLAVILSIIYSIIILIFGEYLLLILAIIMMLFPLFYIYAKAIEEKCMIKSVKAENLTEGDWLYQSVQIKGKTIKPNWEGLSTKELKLFKNYRGKVLVKEGIPFTPAFLLAFLVLLWMIG